MHRPTLPDIRQNFLQLGSIQGVALGLPGVIIPGADYISVILGNFLLWSIALPITLMAFKKRSNAIENVRDFMGRTPCLISCVILSMAFLSWYTIQNKITVFYLANEWGWTESTQSIIGFALALFVGVLTIFGIRYIKHLCFFSLPILIVLIFCMVNSLPPPVFTEISKVSITSIFFSASLVITQNLPGIANLPTFFRHARSTHHAILGLTWMTLIVIFFQIFGVWAQINSPERFFLSYGGSVHGAWSRTLFVIISLACVNSVNIYFATAGLETISLIYQQRKHKILRKVFYYFAFEHPVRQVSMNWGCGIMGVLGALFCLLPESLTFIKHLEEISDNILSNLGMVLFFAFFMGLIMHHRHQILENVTAWLGWLVGSIATLMFQFISQMSPLMVTLMGIVFTSVSFGVVIFCEVNFFSIKKLRE